MRSYNFEIRDRIEQVNDKQSKYCYWGSSCTYQADTIEELLALIRHDLRKEAELYDNEKN